MFLVWKQYGDQNKLSAIQVHKASVTFYNEKANGNLQQPSKHTYTFQIDVVRRRKTISLWIWFCSVKPCMFFSVHIFVCTLSMSHFNNSLILMPT